MLRLLLAGLLVIAQQTALVHAAWHALRAPASAHGQDAPGKPGSPGDGGHARLCVFDAVLGQVLGGACGSPAALVPPVLGVERVTTAPALRCAPSSSPYTSRAPPVLL